MRDRDWSGRTKIRSSQCLVKNKWLKHPVMLQGAHGKEVSRSDATAVTATPAVVLLQKETQRRKLKLSKRL